MLTQVNSAGQYGIVAEQPAHELPLNAWTNGRNVRFRNGYVEKFLGDEQVFGALGTGNTPYQVLPVYSAGTYYWLEMGLAKVFAYNGASHADITNAGGPYQATNKLNWTACVLGGIPILNNGIDPPQAWTNLSGALVDLANWPANYVCGSLRSFKRHLVAMDITKNGTEYPQMVKWSHPAPSGNVPVSWDEGDETKDAGEFELLSSNGAVVDGVPLRNMLALYKEDSVLAMQYVGGIEVFRFLNLFDNFGILSRRCAVEFTSGKHAVFALGDIITHDGQSWDSIVTRRMRDWVFKNISPSNWEMSFVSQIPQKFEVWFCYPTTNATLPDQALVWNWKENTLGIRDLDGVTHLHAGLIEDQVDDTWNSDPNAWDTDSTVWGEVKYNPSGLRVMSVNPGSPMLRRVDSTNQFNGVNFTSFVERTGLVFPVDPDSPPDVQSRKLLRGMWLRIDGTDGAVIKIYFGKQDAIDGPISWEASRDYTIGSTEFLDTLLNGRLFALKIESTGNIDWRLMGYQADVVSAGTF